MGDEPGDPVDYGQRLARPRSGNDQERAVNCRRGPYLRIIQPIEDGGCVELISAYRLLSIMIL